MSAGAPGRAVVDPERLVEDLRALVRIPSVTGSEDAVAGWLAGALGAIPGVAVERLDPDVAAVRADPDWPGEEMPRTALPVVTSSPRATRRRGPSIRGRPRSATASCTVAAPAT